MLTDRCCPRSLQKCLTSINLPLPPLEKLFVFCFLNRAPLTSPRLSLSCAHSHQPRVTLSATQGRQSEHDAKTGRKSRVASGPPKESEDLGMETIKGKPELVCNTCPALLLQPPSCAARWEPGPKGRSSPSRQVVSASPATSSQRCCLARAPPPHSRVPAGRAGGRIRDSGLPSLEHLTAESVNSRFQVLREDQLMTQTQASSAVSAEQSRPRQCAHVCVHV